MNTKQANEYLKLIRKYITDTKAKLYNRDISLVYCDNEYSITANDFYNDDWKAIQNHNCFFDNLLNNKKLVSIKNKKVFLFIEEQYQNDSWNARVLDVKELKAKSKELMAFLQDTLSRKDLLDIDFLNKCASKDHLVVLVTDN